MNRLRATLVISAVAIVTLLAGMAALPTSVGAQGLKNEDKTAQKKAEPRKFGFTVVDVEVEKCCADQPGTPTPDGQVYLTGHDPGGWRFSLSCFPSTAYFEQFHANKNLLTSGNLSDKQKEYWKDAVVASFEPGGHGQSQMRLWTFGDKVGTWQDLGSCFVNGSVDKAEHAFGVYVTSSTYLSKSSQYVVTVTTTGITADEKRTASPETLILKCTEGVQHPCVSVAPKVMWAVRNGSWIRLCDGDFNLVGTYRITSELPR